MVERLLCRLPCRPVLLPVPGAADRRARRRPAVQRRVQAGDRARSARAAGVGRTCSPVASGLPRPAAPMLAVGATAFMFLKDGGDSTMTFDLHIMGGTLASTFAGEFSFMIAMAPARCSSWARWRSCARPQRSDVAPGGACSPPRSPATSWSRCSRSSRRVVIWLAHRTREEPDPGRRRSARSVCSSPRCGCVPLASTLGYTTDMRYEPIGHYLDWMFLGENWFLYPFALVAIGRRYLLPPPGHAGRRRDHVGDRARVLQLGGDPRRLREGAGVEPPLAAVLVPHALPARGAGRR